MIIQILLGLVLGPSFLKLIPYNDFVHVLAEIGAVALLFVIGLVYSGDTRLDPN